MKITFDEICDADDNPGSMSFSEYNRILRGAVKMIMELEKENQTQTKKVFGLPSFLYSDHEDRIQIGSWEDANVKDAWDLWKLENGLI